MKLAGPFATDLQSAGVAAPPARLRATTRVVAVLDDRELAGLDAVAKRSGLEVTRVAYAGARRRGRDGDQLEQGPLVNPLLATLTRRDCDVVVVGLRAAQDNRLLEHLLTAQEHGVDVQTFTTFMERQYGRVPARCVEPSWFLTETHQSRGRCFFTAKRVADLLGGVLLLLLLVLLGGPVAVAIKACSPGPVLFRQARVGYRSRTFEMVKFRTMTVDAEAAGPRFASVGDPRVHAVGRFLRRSRLDELPQALLVLRGDLSLIGPRPERPEFSAAFAEVLPHWDKRHWVRPGLTGWAQVHEGYGAGEQDAEVKLERDLYYMKHHSLRLDLSITWRTVRLCLGLGGR